MTVVQLTAARGARRDRARDAERRGLRKAFEDCVSLRAQINGTDYTQELVEFLCTGLGSDTYLAAYGKFIRVENVTIEAMAREATGR